MTRHPSDLRLELHLLDPQRAQVGDHLDSCAACQGRLSRMKVEGDKFRQYVYPATLDALVKPRRSRWWALSALVPVAAAAAALVLWARPAGDYVGTKGPRLTLVPFLEGPREVADGATVPASAALRFRVSTTQGCRLWLFSIDGQGSVSRLYPQQGNAGAPIHGGQTTAPGGVRLDGKAGPERFFAVCGASDLQYDQVERAARAVAGRGLEAVRNTEALPGLPREAAQSSVLVEKAP